MKRNQQHSLACILRNAVGFRVNMSQARYSALRAGTLTSELNDHINKLNLICSDIEIEVRKQFIRNAINREAGTK